MPPRSDGVPDFNPLVVNHFALGIALRLVVHDLSVVALGSILAFSSRESGLARVVLNFFGRPDFSQRPRHRMGLVTFPDLGMALAAYATTDKCLRNGPRSLDSALRSSGFTGSLVDFSAAASDHEADSHAGDDQHHRRPDDRANGAPWLLVCTANLSHENDGRDALPGDLEANERNERSALILSRQARDCNPIQEISNPQP
jgi:hypothetical protein